MAFKVRVKLGHDSPKHWQLRIETAMVFYIKSECSVGEHLPNSSSTLKKAKNISRSFPSVDRH